jgi:hypothetical protein
MQLIMCDFYALCYIILTLTEPLNNLHKTGLLKLSFVPKKKQQLVYKEIYMYLN